ncbi:hypothetical protein JCM8202v2_005643 [Rhodotorula sphaerocarpa]
MASLASSRSLGLPWTRQQGPIATDASLARYDAAEGRQACRGGDQFEHQPQQHRRPLSSLRTTGTPLNAIHETLIEHDDGPDRVTGTPTFAPEQAALGSLGQTREEDKQASRDPLVPVSLDSEYARILSYSHSSPSALGRRGDASPLSRLSNLWSPTDSSDSTPSEVFPVGSITSDDGQIRSASVETTPPSLLGGFKINKAKPQPLDLASNKEASTCLLSPPVDISEYRRDSFTFYLPADLRLDSPSPPGVGAGAKQNRPFGSSALLHSPQPRRPSLVLASEHATLADDPYTPCWDVEPLPSSETSLLPVAATQDHKTSLGECFSGEIPPAHANGTRTVPPRRTQAAQDRQAAELEAIFRPRTVNRPALAQPGPAGVVTVASVSTELPVGYPLSPEDVERVAKLHNGRIPSIQQLAPADNARSDKYEPIVNTGNQGPMVVQAGDWRCGNWRRRHICLRCFPYANDIGKVLTIQSHRVAHLATPPSSTTLPGKGPVPPFGPAHTRIASAPVCMPSAEMYPSGIPSADVLALARSASYPSSLGLPYRPATTAAIPAAPMTTTATSTCTAPYLYPAYSTAMPTYAPAPAQAAPSSYGLVSNPNLAKVPQTPPSSRHSQQQQQPYPHGFIGPGSSYWMLDDSPASASTLSAQSAGDYYSKKLLRQQPQPQQGPRFATGSMHSSTRPPLVDYFAGTTKMHDGHCVRGQQQPAPALPPKGFLLAGTVSLSSGGDYA